MPKEGSRVKFKSSKFLIIYENCLDKWRYTEWRWQLITVKNDHYHWNCIQSMYNVPLQLLFLFPLELYSRVWRGMSTVLNMYFFLSYDPSKKLGLNIKKVLHAYLDYTYVSDVYTLWYWLLRKSRKSDYYYFLFLKKFSSNKFSFAWDTMNIAFFDCKIFGL